MEAESQATPSSAAKKKASASGISPAKAAPLEGQIFTPEKLEQLPLRFRNRGVALSVEEVRRAALGLRRPLDRSGIAQYDSNLSSVEQQLGVGSAPCSSPKSKVKELAKIPQKYELLCEFFNSMASSLRLLKLKGSMPTFSNICTSIQHLTERRFTHTHLAQLKYIFPEAITVKKVLLHDETTCCMKPELQINLQVEAIKKNIKGKSESSYSILRVVFRERLLSFVKEHPEGDDVPEVELPHPFNQTKLTANPLMNINANATFRESSPSVTSQQHFIAPSLTSQCFQRRFSSKIPIPDSEKTPLACLSDASICNDISMFVAPSFGHASAPQVHRKQLLRLPTTGLLTKGGSDEGNEDMLRSDDYLSKEPNCREQTPAKRLSTPLRLMGYTPECPAPKRCRTTPSQDSPILEKFVKRPTKTKLFTTEEDEDRILSADEDVLNILPKSLLQSIREKEMKALQEEEAGVGDASRRKKLIASLPNAFDMILLSYQSWKKSVVTKHELIDKLTSNHCKTIDRGEVEEQLKLLLELTPDWISERTAICGGILCCLNKAANAEEIRRRLLEAE